MKGKNTRREEGQSLIIVGALLLVLLALVGLVLDAGNAYAQRRIVQNAADAAALAGAQVLVHQEDYLLCANEPETEGCDDGSIYLTNRDVLLKVEEFAEANGVDPADLTVAYTDIDGNLLADASDLGLNTIIDATTFGGTRPEGLRVQADRLFDTYLVRLVGWNQMEARGTALGILACGACTAGGGQGLFPIAVHIGTFENDPQGLPVKGFEYRVWDDKTGPGSFGWLSWNDDPTHASEPTLIENMADTSLSGEWSVGDMIPAGPGRMMTRDARAELVYRIDNRVDLDPPRPAEVTLPIFDYTEGNGSNLKYHIVGFGRFELHCYHFSQGHMYGECAFDGDDTSHWISGIFVDWAEPTGEAGCTNFGICTSKLRPNLEETRAVVGNVLPWRAMPQDEELCAGDENAVDVVHVLDISGSMCAHWDGSSHRSPPCSSGERIQTAKDVITEFNEGMDWNADNQIGLATYPTIQYNSGRRYYRTDCYNEIRSLGGPCDSSSSSDCLRETNLLYKATKEQPLTSNFAWLNDQIDDLEANGGTSMPLGLQYGREMVTDPDHHNPDNLKVLILTTDGMANVKIDGYASGYLGNYTLPYWIVTSGCNESVYSAAVQQANQAKEQGVIVFTIGIHENIDVDLMTAIATQDSDPSQPHFFQATTGMDFQEIYEQLQERLPYICSEECTVHEQAVQGGGATVRLYNEDGALVETTTADSSGYFVFNDLEAGTYELRATWHDGQYNILYDLMTALLGGDPLDEGEKILVVVPEGTGTTHRDLYLRTSQQVPCD